LQRLGKGELKAQLWNAFVDSELLGITDDDCAAWPRVLPASCLPAIWSSARAISSFVMRLLSLPEAELRAILPHTPVAEFLLDELKVLSHRGKRLTGSFRFDMAIEGPPHADNPPKLLEINEIGFDGTARSSHIQRAFLTLLPELATRLQTFDTAASETHNMRRLGKSLLRLQYDSYNWEEQVLAETGKRCGLDLRMVSPTAFACELDPDCVRLARARLSLEAGRLRVAGDPRPCDSWQMGYSFDLKDYQEAPGFFAMLARAKTPQYGPFLSALVASKSILVLLSDPALRRRLLDAQENRTLERALPPAWPLSDRLGEVRAHARPWVLKHVDSMGGEQVFVGREIRPQLRKIKPRRIPEWVVQRRIRLNTIDVHGILSRPRRVMADLGVFIHYDWTGDRFANFAVGGFITRATNRSTKVNVSGGGIQVPVMFDRQA